MKKILSLVAVIMLCTGIQAQIETSGKIWFLRAGLNVMNFTGDGAKGSDLKTGYNAMVGFQKPLGSAGGYWSMEAGFGSRGFKVGETKSIAHNIQYSPFTFGWKFDLENKFKIDTHIGVYASYDYSSKMKENGVRISWGDFADLMNEAASYTNLDVSYNRFDAGMGIGAGIWYGRYNLDLTYQHGFIDAFTESDGFKSSNFMIRLGIAF